MDVSAEIRYARPSHLKPQFLSVPPREVRCCTTKLRRLFSEVDKSARSDRISWPRNSRDAGGFAKASLTASLPQGAYPASISRCHKTISEGVTCSIHRPLACSSVRCCRWRMKQCNVGVEKEYLFEIAPHFCIFGTFLSLIHI